MLYCVTTVVLVISIVFSKLNVQSSYVNRKSGDYVRNVEDKSHCHYRPL